MTALVNTDTRPERARRMTPVTVLTSGVCQQCGATTEECREGVSEQRTCCEECDHYPTPVV